MSDNELLLAISQMMDAKLAPVYHQLDSLQESMGRLESRMGRLEDRVASMESRMDNVEKELNAVKTGHGARLTHIELLLENEVIPRLSTIEACYTSTFDRYKTYAERADAAYKEIPLMKKVITDHSDRIMELEKKIS